MDRNRRALKSELNCCSIGTVNAFDATKQTATVQINFLRVIQGYASLQSPFADLSSDYTLPYPLLVNCPVFFLTGGDARLTLPIAAGDTCIILFCDKDIDTWFASGQISAPNSRRTHDLNDGIALVGIRSLLNKLSDYSADAVELKYKGAVLKIDVNGHASFTDDTSERLCQSGFLQPYAGSTAPPGWLLCYGQSISKTTYAKLFAVIGYTYGGSGDNFNVPDLRGRTVAGLDNMGGSDANVLTNAYNPNRNTLGGPTGEEAHELSESEHHVHNHEVYPVCMANGSGVVGYQGTDNGAAPTTLFTENEGGSVAHQNVQPTMMINWIIKT
jgi:microcystin-dependent protein